MKHPPGSLKYRVALAIAFLSLVAILGSQPAPREQVGPLPGGGFLLNSGWRLDPVGKQIPLDTLPMSTALSPDGKYLLVLNGGYRPPSRQRDRSRLRPRHRQRSRCRWLAGPRLHAQRRPRLCGRRLQSVRLRIHLRRRRAHPRAHLRRRAAGAARHAGFHRRRGLLARRPPALRRRPVSRFASRWSIRNRAW